MKKIVDPYSGKGKALIGNGRKADIPVELFESYEDLQIQKTLSEDWKTGILLPGNNTILEHPKIDFAAKRAFLAKLNKKRKKNKFTF